MTQLFAYRLRLKSSLHIGSGRTDDLTDIDELPRSDTLAAALLSVWGHVTLGQSDIGSLAADPPFAVSSALPTLELAGKTTCLLPMPVGLLDQLSDGRAVDKQLRRARFVAPDLFPPLLRGELPEEVAVVGTCLLPARDAFAVPLWTTDTRLRLAVNRLGDGPIEGLLYEFGAVSFRPDVSLTVVACFDSADVQRGFEAALRFLGDEGIGADRSCGYGCFEVAAAGPFRAELGKGMRLSLSLMHPTLNEVDGGLLGEPARYEFEIRGGWVTSPGARTLRRRGVRMLREGSVLRDLGARPYGDSPCVLDALPELGLGHPVYRPGKAVTLPITWSPAAGSPS